jgi:hypothetical protein
MCVQPHQVVRTAWVDIDLCKLGSLLPMSPEAVEKKFRRLMNIGYCAPWSPIVGHWESGRFVVCDGRNDYLAALMMGSDRVFVCWLEAVDAAAVEIPSATAAEPPNDEIGRLPTAGDGQTSVSSYSAAQRSRRNLWPRAWRRRCGSTSTQVREADAPPRPASTSCLRPFAKMSSASPRCCSNRCQ